LNPRNPEQIPDDETEVSFVPMPAVEAGTGKMHPEELRPWGSVRKGYTRFQEGDVLFAKITPCMENGKTVVAAGLHGGVGAGSTEFHVLRTQGIANRTFLMYFLLQESFRKEARANMTGTAGQLRVPKRFLEEYELGIPPLPEQHRIVAAIESYLTRLDDAVASLERVQKNLKRYRASVLKAAVEGRLVPTEAELARKEGRTYEPAGVLLERILKERRRRWEEAELAKMKAKGKVPKNHKWKERYKEPVAPDTSDLPELPEGWVWVSVEQLAGFARNSLADGPFGSNLKTSHYTESGPRVVRLQNIGDGEFLDAEAHISEQHYERLARHAVSPGDLVVASLGTELPRVCRIPDSLGPAIVKADCLRFAPNVDIACSVYLMHALNSMPTRKRTEELVHGVGRPRIGLTLLRTVPVPLPPYAEQLRIGSEVEKLLSIGKEGLALVDSSSSRCQRLRQSILKWAFEGKLVDQEPADEPASVLLERIKAERAKLEAQKKANKKKTSRRRKK